METTLEAPKRKRGRPSIYSRELAETICRRLARGETMRSICDDEGMPDITTVFKWEAESPEFIHLSSRAREHGTHMMADECISIADNPTLDPNDKRIRIDTRLRLIGKWNAKKYGDKIAMEHDVQHKFIPLDELADKVRKIQLENNRLMVLGGPAAPENPAEEAP